MFYKTEQEKFWAGEFGAGYIQRNQSEQLLASNLDFFSKSLRMASSIDSCIEFGANIGMNLKALKLLYPHQELHGIEINENAAHELSKTIPASNVFHKSIMEFGEDRQWDLVLIKGVLIHVNPDELPTVYSKLVEASSRYILVAEYYNPSPVSITYRGHDNRLFKRDFAGEILNKYPEFELIDYGFLYHKDPNFPQDDITWFLLRK
jgi:pseudaminic acid biosynthesis-associated methylase